MTLTRCLFLGPDLVPAKSLSLMLLYVFALRQRSRGGPLPLLNLQRLLRRIFLPSHFGGSDSLVLAVRRRDIMHY